MKKISATTLQEALQKASVVFECSVAEIEYEIVSEPSSGFLGIGRRDAVIVARKKDIQPTEVRNQQQPKDQKVEKHIREKNRAFEKCDGIEQNFFKQPDGEIEEDIRRQVLNLFALLPYEIGDIKVQIGHQQSVNLEFVGNDCGLLIGEKGYRYSAIYHILSIWLKKEYDLNLRLEIADFLKNKEKKIEEYLEENFDRMSSRGTFQTKPFDQVSVYLALKRFRAAIPHRYIVSKPLSENESIIVINDFKGK
ncbi:hypothetical protein BBW65_01850 [Helicobacter enhydrae]|uniref:RNA-binding protein KhpB N-terminal domain-containing protein n=1 Tax=Helicobacter enhydrae TaxID=222136 RepID=A0A1B1U4A7_9HELI|nr:Jag N-terminal domain-containing protein [Helicobacter enhydrae]ANV97624.1 hypothetical protein BBW65_01850 [Helicobacter enhydrae]